MWIRKIQKRKIQFILIALLSMMATAILTACLAFMIETFRFSESYFDYHTCPMYFAVSAQENADEILLKDEKIADFIDHISSSDAKHVEDDFYADGRKIANEGNFFYEMEDINQLEYAVNIVKGEKSKAPKNGEVWISHVFADAYDVELGQEFCVGKDEKLVVSAIVNSQMCCSGFIDVYPFYVNESELQSIPGKDGHQFLIFANREISKKEFEDAIPSEFRKTLMQFMDTVGLKLSLSILTTIFGCVGIVSAIIIMAVSIVVFRYLVRATISKEYQMIGIYKALGKTDKEIKQIYFCAYLVSGIAGMIPGALIARVLAVYLAEAVLLGVKGFGLTNITLLLGVAVVLFFIIMLLINLAAEIRKVQKISPLQAINLNNLSSEEKLCKPIIRSAYSSFNMAVNDMVKRPGQSFFVILILTVSIYMILFASATALTLSHYSDDRPIWENLPNYDCIIKSDDNPDILKYLEDNKNIEEYVRMTNRPKNCSGMDIEGTQWTPDESHPLVYENFTLDRYKDIPFLEGRICTNKHEIAASKIFLHDADKKVGDYIEISHDDKRIDFLITGCYSAMMQGGTSFYIQEEDFRELGLEPNFDTILIFLKDSVSYEDFSKDFEQANPDGHIYEDFNFVEQEGNTVGGIAYPICMVLIVSFFAFSVLNIINLIHTQNKENRKKYGILKAMGFTNGYICRENLFTFTFEFIAAVGLSIIIHNILSPILFSFASGVLFIRKSIWLTCLVCGIVYMILLIIDTGMLLSVKKIKPIELMEE